MLDVPTLVPTTGANPGLARAWVVCKGTPTGLVVRRRANHIRLANRRSAASEIAHLVVPNTKIHNSPVPCCTSTRENGKDLFDMYVSSYASLLSALLRGRDCLRSQREARTISGTPDVISFTAVGQAHPSTDTQLSRLPEAEYKLERIWKETSMSLDVNFGTIIGPAASIEGAVEAFRGHRWVRVACHGAQHTEKPFDSCFAMGDGKLRLMRIIQELRVCVFIRAIRRKEIPDEVLYLAAGMQFAGLNGVIGTLWRVDDAVAHQVVTRFYKETFKQPIIDFKHAAAVVTQTDDEVLSEKRIAFVHIGI